MRRLFIAVTLSLAFTTTVAHAVEQAAFSAAGIIESTTGGFRFPNGTVQTTASEGGLSDLVCAADEIAKYDGAYWVCAADNDTDLSAQVAELQALVATLQSQLAANTAADAAAHHDKYTDAEAIAAVGSHSPDFTDLLADVSRGIDPNTGYDTIQFSGMNVQIVNGSGVTAGTTNGTGNLIIGYNEMRNEGLASVPCPSDVATELWCNRRWGSHMVVVGAHNNYSSYGGMVVGRLSETAGGYSSISGGRGNIASGIYSSVTGGDDNLAEGHYSSVTGGDGNITYGQYSSVSGGYYNYADGSTSSVSGGRFRTAYEDYNWVAGGLSEDN